MLRLNKAWRLAFCMGMLGGLEAGLGHFCLARADDAAPAARGEPADVAEVRAALAAPERQFSAAAMNSIGSSAGRDLSMFTELSPEAAAVIAASAPQPLPEHWIGAIDLSGLKSLSEPVARQLAAYPGRLVLNGIEELSPAAAAALGKKVGEHGCMSLAGLRTLTPEAARAVGGCKNILVTNFPQLRTLSPEAARALIDGVQRNPRKLGGDLLDLGIESLSPELAAELADNRGDLGILRLPGLRELSPEAAAALAKFRGHLLIRCPGGRLTPELLGLMTAAGIKNGAVGTEWTGIRFHLVGLEVLTPDDVANLAKANPFNPALGGIRRLAPETAKAIVAQLPRNALYFPDLVDVPPEFAGASFNNENLQIAYDPEAPKKFVQSAETLTAEIARIVVAIGASGHASSLDGITAIESRDAAALAAMLAKSNAGLALPNLRRVSPKTLAALLAKEGIEIPLIETLELIDEPDGSPTEDFVVPEAFEKRQQVARLRADPKPDVAAAQPDEGKAGPRKRRERRRPRGGNRDWDVQVPGAADVEVIEQTPTSAEFRLTVPLPGQNQNQK